MATQSPIPDASIVRLALPKGHMQENIFKVLEEAGLKVSLGSARGYRPVIPLDDFDVKLLKPQNILGMLENGSRDIGFAGADWVQELGVEVVELLDTGLDPVRLVAASPDKDVLEHRAPLQAGRSMIVASEYTNICKKWMSEKGIDASFLRAYGATESLPPEDADLIVDNTATGSTLRANGLHIVDTLMHSTTRLFASKAALENPDKKKRIDAFVLLLKSVLDARTKMMVAFNVNGDESVLDRVLQALPSTRAPTVAALYGNVGWAVQAVVPAKLTPTLIPDIEAKGGSEVVVSAIRQFVP